MTKRLQFHSDGAVHRGVHAVTKYYVHLFEAALIIDRPLISIDGHEHFNSLRKLFGI